MGTRGVGIMNSTAFSLLASNNPGIDENQEMELTFGSLSFYIGPLGLTRLSDPTKSASSASKTEKITASGSSVGSSSEVNSPVSLTATEDMIETLEEFDETQGKLDKEEATTKNHGIQGISPSKTVAFLEAYISYALLSLKQRKRAIKKAAKRSICKSKNRGVVAKRKRRKFMFQQESVKSSCHPSITAQRYPQIQGEKF
jgi:hypothetical protein